MLRKKYLCEHRLVLHSTIYFSEGEKRGKVWYIKCLYLVVTKDIPQETFRVKLENDITSVTLVWITFINYLLVEYDSISKLKP